MRKGTTALTKKQFEKRLKEQAYAAVPDRMTDLLKTISAESDRIVSLSDDEDEPHLVPVIPAQSHSARWLALAACFAVVVLAVVVAATDNRQRLTTRGSVGGGDKSAATVTTAFSAPMGSSTGVSQSAFGSGTGENDQRVTSNPTNTTGTGTYRQRHHGTVTSNRGSFTTGRTTAKSVPDKRGGTTVSPTVPPITERSVTALPSTKKSTDKTTKTTVETRSTAFVQSHIVRYIVPVSADGSRAASADDCVKKVKAGTQSDITAAPTLPPTTSRQGGEFPPPTEAPTVAPTTKKQSPVYEGTFRFEVTYQKIGTSDAWRGYENLYTVDTVVRFDDGWSMEFFSVCAGKTVLFTDFCCMTDKGVVTESRKYDRETETMLTVRQDVNGNETYRGSRKIPLGSVEFMRNY